MFDVNRIAGEVIGSSGGANASSVFRLDTVKYSWVRDFARDQEIRTEIESLRQEILEAGKLPIHRDALRKQFENAIKNHNEFRIQQIKEQLSSVQNRQEFVLMERSIGERKVIGSLYLPYLINLSSSDIDAIFSDLPEGNKQKDIDQTLEKCQQRIKKLEAVISQELSPQSRWIYREDGVPKPYPQGCRWKTFVAVWQKVQERFDGPVNINGGALRTEAEYMAHAVLKLDKVHKTASNLREPIISE